MAFNYCDIDIVFEGNGINEKGINKKTGKTLLDISHKFYRPAEVDLLIGDSSKAKKELGWAAKTNFENLLEMMIYDLSTLR